MIWHYLILGWGVPLAFWVAVKACAHRTASTSVRKETAALQSSQQISRRSLPGVLSVPEHLDQGVGMARPGVSWTCALRLFVSRRMDALVSREAPEFQSSQQAPRRTRRQLSQGVSHEGLHDRNRNSREMILKEQADRERLAHGVLPKPERINKDRYRQ
jgi:hypothetical protein